MAAQTLEDVVAACVAGRLALGSDQATTQLWDVLQDPDNWDASTFAPLAKLRGAARGARTEKGLVKLERLTVIPGDLIVDGDVECLSHTLVVGDLRATGYVYSGIHDCLVVAGDVSARALEALRSYWLIGGSIEAETIWLSTYGFLRQRGAVRARLLVREMYFELLNDRGVDVATRIETDYLAKDAAANERLRGVVDPTGLLDEEGRFSSWALLRAVARGKPVFIGDAVAKKPAKKSAKKPAEKPAKKSAKKPAKRRPRRR